MSIFEKGLGEIPAIASLLNDIDKGRLPAMVTGTAHIHKALLIHTVYERLHRPAVVLTADEAEASRLCEDLAALGGTPLLYPARELSLRGAVSVSRDYEKQRLGVLSRMLSGDYTAVVACAEAAAQLTLPPEVLTDCTIRLTAGKKLPVSDLPSALSAAGYERFNQVEGPGQMAVRGGIIDVYAAQGEHPLRIELWGDTVDTIAYFDVLSQRRLEAVESVYIPPATELLTGDPAALAEKLTALMQGLRGKKSEERQKHLSEDIQKLQNGMPIIIDRYLPLLYPREACLLDYADDAVLFLSESTRVRDSLKNASVLLNEEITALLEEGCLCRELTRYTLDWNELSAQIGRGDTVVLETFARSGCEWPIRELYTVRASTLSVWSGKLELLCEELEALLARGAACVVLAGAEEKTAQVLAEDLAAKGLPALYASAPPAPLKGRVLVVRGGLSAGVDFPEANFAVLTHGATVSVRRRFRRNKRDKRTAIHSLEELTPGNYVVHAAHGIGIYEGIRQLEIQGVIKDYICLKYDKGDTLYLPVTQMDLISKYIGTSEDVRVKLHRLGGQEWQKTKTRVRAAVKEIAAQLTALYAKRMSAPGFAFDPDGEWQFDFERHFEYAETEDQLRCADEIKSDMERPIPMDRLLCGDVGFGKTEVALRAAFKCVAQGKQCVLLVPTTILAYQHYHTILQRFESFPVKVEMLSRFRTAKQQEEIVKRTARGDVDILVGTHRLLSKDIVFRDLGLFIVDEEQRFGVAQKERIKEMAPNVDVLTLTATPIPRTLNMALSGIRDMSIIEEAPHDRLPVQTYVIEHDNGVLTEAIRRELRRGGQVYYLHNRVESIERCAAGIQMRIPEARVAFAHGKMTEDELSDIWRAVLEREIDVLVCTTIIETGVDISNVNTLIIENADRYGLSQLHQLRGRVGRSSRRAYAYLTFVRGKVLSEVAEKRLEAMREFTEFGAGFKIAMRDMEIRGAGNLLGAQQHGHMEAVGYDMYLKLLADAVTEQKDGKPAASETECLIDLPISAHIPESYIAANEQRLEMYRHIADIRTHEDSLEVYDELIDRFGEPPEAVQGLVEVALLRQMAASLGIVEIKQQEQTLLLYQKTLRPEVGVKMSSALKGRVMISAGSKPYFAVKIKQGLTSLDTLREALEAAAKEN